MAILTHLNKVVMCRRRDSGPAPGYRPLTLDHRKAGLLDAAAQVGLVARRNLGLRRFIDWPHPPPRGRGCHYIAVWSGSGAKRLPGRSLRAPANHTFLLVGHVAVQAGLRVRCTCEDGRDTRSPAGKQALAAGPHGTAGRGRHAWPPRTPRPFQAPEGLVSTAESRRAKHPFRLRPAPP